MRLIATTLIALLAATAASTPSAGHEAWETVRLIDDWGELAGYAYHSPFLTPARAPDFPYEDIEAGIIIECNGPARIDFTLAPVLTNIEWETATRTFLTLPARIDGIDKEYEALQRRNREQTLFFVESSFMDGITYSQAITQDLAEGNNVAFLIPFHGEGNIRFTWPLTGYTEARHEACCENDYLKDRMDDAYKAYQEQNNRPNRQAWQNAARIYHDTCEGANDQ